MAKFPEDPRWKCYTWVLQRSGKAKERLQRETKRGEATNQKREEAAFVTLGF